MNELQGVTVFPHLLLITVAQVRLPEEYRPDPRLVYLDALNPVGRDRAFNDRVLPQNL